MLRLILVFLLISPSSFAADFCEEFLMGLPTDIAVYKGHLLKKNQKITFKGQPAILENWTKTLDNRWIVYVEATNRELGFLNAPFEINEFLANTPGLELKGEPPVPDLRDLPHYDGQRLSLRETPDPLSDGQIYHMRRMSDDQRKRIPGIVKNFPELARELGFTYDKKTETYSYPGIIGLVHRLKLLGKKWTAIEIDGNISKLKYAKLIAYHRAIGVATRDNIFLHHHDVFNHAIGAAFIPERALEISRSRFRFLLEARETILGYKRLSKKRRDLFIKRLNKFLQRESIDFDFGTGGLTHRALVHPDSPVELIGSMMHLTGRSARELKDEFLQIHDDKINFPPGLRKKLSAIPASHDSATTDKEIRSLITKMLKTMRNPR